MTDKNEERSPYDIQKGDIVEVISRSLKRRERFSGIGFVLGVNEEGAFKIYWRDRKDVRLWEFGHGYLKRVNRA